MSENAAPATDRTELGQFEVGNQAGLVHGGEGAIKRLQRGEAFDGLAREVYEDVLGELGIDLDRLSGLDRILTQRALRFEATARMFDVAQLAAAAAGDVDRWELYCRRGHWVGGKAFKALVDLRQVLTGGSGVIDYEGVTREAESG